MDISFPVRIKFFNSDNIVFNVDQNTFKKAIDEMGISQEEFIESCEDNYMHENLGKVDYNFDSIEAGIDQWEGLGFEPKGKFVWVFFDKIHNNDGRLVAYRNSFQFFVGSNQIFDGSNYFKKFDGGRNFFFIDEQSDQLSDNVLYYDLKKRLINKIKPFFSSLDLSIDDIDNNSFNSYDKFFRIEEYDFTKLNR